MKPIARRRARERTVQALYSWKFSKNDIFNIKNQFLSQDDIKDVDILYFCKLLLGVAMNATILDLIMAPYLSRHINKLDQIEHGILQIALFELKMHQEIPYKVVINEAVELAKTFGSEDSYKFINAVLDKIVSTFIKNRKL
ncbi:Transcription antitermination protein NusB [Candidatus Ecksteinia adelgidicola]|nr:Transcription antitermination protein NusB [Candidatus Ecksteinia adelgidicola]